MASSSPRASSYRWEQRVFRWRELVATLEALEDRKPITPEALREAVQLYPELARDLASARQEAPGSRLTVELEDYYQRLHRALFRAPRLRLDDTLRFLRNDLPALAQGLRLQILSLGLAFVFFAVAGWWLVSTFPELASLFASDEMIETVEGGKLWTSGLLNIMPSSVLSVEIFTNNVMVALFALCLGALYGLGTLYILALNGLMLGGIFAFTAQHGLADDLFEFVIAHGVVELSIIVIASAIGFSIGEALARPGELQRSEAFRRAVQRGMRLMLPCLVFLIGAGFIEGYISPDPGFALWMRVLVGVGYFLLFIFFLNGWYWRVLPHAFMAKPSEFSHRDRAAEMR
ncbi:MAG: stage II sporulation protein M [Pseudomonadota bacterium]